MRLAVQACSFLLALSSALLSGGCSPKIHSERPLGGLLSSQTPPGVRGRVLVTGAVSGPAFLERARARGIAVEEGAVLQLVGDVTALRELELQFSEDAAAAWDGELVLKRSAPSPYEKSYIAGREFGLEEFFKTCPDCDGRGVLAGVLDDGVSPLLGGLRSLPGGGRKFIAKGSTSSLLRFPLKQVAASRWEGVIEEPSLKPLRGNGRLDLNLDGKLSPLPVSVETGAGLDRVCIDSNANGALEARECHGTFPETGEIGWWNEERQLEWTAEFDRATGLLSLTEGERTGIAEAHGEGVASVLLGYQIGGRWNGVAPGAKLLDYDIWAGAAKSGETLYTMSQFLRGLEWFGQRGAEVVNISYSLHFASAKSQEFMHTALDALVRKYGFVVSVSAGNDGPGVASLHRRGIFPSNVLVTGAYLSRELAETVNGETDVPEEGRVAWYSSRGPGPDGGSPATVIAPVSSLVHRTPGAGYSSFSGTSSASPALAGLAAVLISSAKKADLPVNALGVVHALRLSARPLPNTAFIDQGYGVPRIAEALEIYRRLISGREFAYVDTEIANLTGADGLPAAGWLIRASEKRERFEARVRLRGVRAVTPGARGRNAGELIRPIELRYSHPWLTGPKNLWLAESPSMFSLDVDLSGIRFPTRGGEVTGEIAVVDQETGRTLLVIPVTVVDDFRFDSEQESAVVLGTEDGTRIHFESPAGITGLRLTSDLPREMEGYLELKLYDSSGNMTYSPQIKGGPSDMLIPIGRPGWYQLAFYRTKGAGKPYRFPFKFAPVSLRLENAFVDTRDPVLLIDQYGPTGDFLIDLIREDQVVSSGLITPDSNGEYVLSIVAGARERYTVDALSTRVTDVSDFVPDCYWTREEANSETFSGQGRTHVTPAGFRGRLTFGCRAFEHMGGSWLKDPWEMKISRSYDRPWMGRKTWARLAPGTNHVALERGEAIVPGTRFGVLLRPVFGSGFLKLGVVLGVGSAL